MTKIKKLSTSELEHYEMLCRCFTYLSDSDYLREYLPTIAGNREKLFTAILRSEIFELAEMLAFHIMEQHYDSPALYFICYILIKELVVNEMYKNDEVSEEDMLIHITQRLGTIGMDVNFEYDCEEDDEIFTHADKIYDLYQKTLSHHMGMTKDRLFNDEHINTDLPFTFIRDYQSEETWDALAYDYLGPFVENLDVCSFLHEICYPHFVESPKNKEKISDNVKKIANKLMNYLENEFISKELWNDVKEEYYEIKTFPSETQFIEDNGWYYLNVDCFNRLIESLNGRKDYFHSYCLTNLLATYKSIYMCKHLTCYSTSIQLYHVFASWAAVIISSDEEKIVEDCTWSHSSFEAGSECNLDIILNPQARVAIYNDFCDNKAKALYDDYYSNKHVGDYDEFAAKLSLCDTYGIDLQFASILRFTSDFLECRETSDTDWCYETFGTSTCSFGGRIDLSIYGCENNPAYDYGLCQQTLECTNILLLETVNIIYNKIATAYEEKCIDEFYETLTKILDSFENEATDDEAA